MDFSQMDLDPRMAEMLGQLSAIDAAKDDADRDRQYNFLAGMLEAAQAPAGGSGSATTNEYAPIVLLRQGSVRYELLAGASACPGIYQQSSELLAMSFHLHEPMTTATGVTIDAHRDFFDMMMPQMCDNGLSVVALESNTEPGDTDVSASDTVLGVFIAEDFATPAPSGPSGFDGFMEKHGEGPMASTLALLDQVEEDLKAKLALASTGGVGADVPRGQYCHLWCVGVDERAQGRGIAKTLSQLVLQQAQQQGFGLSFAEATGEYSARALAKMGMVETAVYLYKDWEMEPGSGVRPFAGTAEPHVGTRLMEIQH